MRSSSSSAASATNNAHVQFVIRLVDRIEALARRYGHTRLRVIPTDINIAAQSTAGLKAVPSIAETAALVAAHAKHIQVVHEKKDGDLFLILGNSAQNEKLVVDAVQSQAIPIHLVECSPLDVQYNRDVDVVVDAVCYYGVVAVTVVGTRNSLRGMHKYDIQCRIAQRLENAHVQPWFAAVDELASVPVENRQFLVIDRAHLLGSREHAQWIKYAACGVLLVGSSVLVPSSPGLTLAHLWQPSRPLDAPTLREYAMALLTSPRGRWLALAALVPQRFPPIGKEQHVTVVSQWTNHHVQNALKHIAANCVHAVTPHELLERQELGQALVLLESELCLYTIHDWLSLLVGGWAPCSVVLNQVPRAPLTSFAFMERVAIWIQHATLRVRETTISTTTTTTTTSTSPS